MAQWEYCTVTNFHASAVVVYQTKQGTVAEIVDSEKIDRDQFLRRRPDHQADFKLRSHSNDTIDQILINFETEETRAKLVARLGLEGWELVSVDAALYFKRQIGV